LHRNVSFHVSISDGTIVIIEGRREPRVNAARKAGEPIRRVGLASAL